MNTCIICKHKVWPICRSCAKNPFLVEKTRQVLADFNKFDALKKTYNLKYAEIKNLNTSSFWNRKYYQDTTLKNQDGMTRDRVKTAYKFLPKTAKEILDIGAGKGFIEELLTGEDIRILGNDISEVSVKNLKSKFKGQFRKESIYTMKYPEKSFDAIFALEVLEHIPPSRIMKVLKKIYRLLKNKGTFILSVPTNEGLEKMKENPSGHVRTYTENLISAELRIAGFKVHKLKTLSAFKNLYPLKKQLSKIIKNRWEANDIILKAQV